MKMSHFKSWLKKISLFRLIIFGLVICSSYFLVILSKAYAQGKQGSQTVPEFIESFTTEIEILPDTSLKISEKILFKTQLEKHGIFRFIPLKIKSSSGVERFSIKNFSVQLVDGGSVPWTSQIENNNFVAKIGDPNRTFSGQQHYQLNYEISYAVDHYDSYDELYWDITGEDWNFPINQAVATISSPHAEIVDAKCFTGKFGSADSNCNIEFIDSSQVSVTSKQLLNPGENLTVVLKLEQPNQLTFPSWWQKNNINWLVILQLIGTVISGPIMGYLWWRKGRDTVSLSHVYLSAKTNEVIKKPLFWRRPVPFHYEPFTDLSPAQVELIRTETIPNRALAAEIIDLARKKALSIKVEQKKRLFSTKDEYSLIKNSKQPNLPDHQSFLVSAIFKKNNKVKLSELKGTFYQQFLEWKKKVEQSLKSGKYFTATPSKQKGIYFAVAGSLIVVSGAALFSVWETFLFWPIILIGLVLIFMISSTAALIFAWQMPAKTLAGWRISQLANGLKKTIERGKWREEIKEKNLFIEEVLPFAIGLGVVDKIAKDMKDLGIAAPEYLGSNTVVASNLINFTNDFSQQVNKNLAFNPSSSGSGSGSSGFSGGGFSGGGGGGGGGGSW